MNSLTLINRIMSHYRRALTGGIMLLALLIVAAPRSGCWAAEGSYQASAVVFEKADTGLALTIKGNMSPTFTTYQLFDPLRVVIDIANASFAESLRLPIEVNQAPVAKITGILLTEKKPEIAKFEVLLSTDSPYKVQRNDNDITIVFGDGVKEDKPTAKTAKMVPEISAPMPQAKDGQQASHQKREPLARPEIYDIKINKAASPLTVLLVADGPLQKFNQVTLPKGDGRPDRMYIDIPGIKAPALERRMAVGAGGVAQIRIADRAEGARFVFDSSLDRLFTFEVAPAPEGLLVTIGADAGLGDPPRAANGQVANDPVAKILASASPPGSALANSASQGPDHADLAARPPAPQASATNDEFAAAGYNREQITVDFYKTNLHNVFRLMGEVGGNNIVVDESVSGVLTLSLREVPWDFLLDVILNLKDLQKVERYNTIVISAKDKGFVWPEKAVEEKKEEPLVEAPGAEISLAIDQQLNQPPAVLEAKMLMQRGNALARDGKFKEALGLYQNALDLWPDNADLAKRMAGMCLVDLGYYQAAVDYAKKALAIKPDDTEAALQAAVGLANMHQAEARLYFEKAVSGSQPSRSALLSYASFQEDHEDLAGTLATLAKFTELYNANLDTMIARARIFDKQEQPDRAVAEYKAILLSGYDLAPDLAQYIKGRIALANKQ